MKIYTTQIIDWIDNSKDSELFSLIYRQGRWGVRKPGVLFAYTKEEIEEIIRCKENILYFAEKYCKIIDNVTGERILIILRDYQKELLKALQNDQFNLAMSTRQTGITIIESIWLLHDLIFNEEKEIVVMNNSKVLEQKIEKVKHLYISLPYFLKPGMLNFSKTELRTELRSRIITVSDSSPLIGFQVHTLNVSDCGRLSETAQRAIEQALLPTMCAIKGTKVFLSNTGLCDYSMFYKLFADGEAGKNDFNTHRIYWWQVPGRGEEWKRREIANLGSEELFNQEYDLSFLCKEKSLPLTKLNTSLPIVQTPIYESLFIVHADLPSAFLENIIGYDLDVDNKRITLSVNLKKETLKDLELLPIESIKIYHHDSTGVVLIKTELETITNPSFMSISASYNSQNLLIGKFTFYYGTIYQNFL